MKDLKRNKLKVINLIIIVCCIMFLATSSYADSIQDSKPFTGFKRLLEDAGKALLVISIPVGIAVTAYCFLRRGAADEMDYKKWTTRIHVAIGSTIGAISAGAIISVVSSYFK